MSERDDIISKLRHALNNKHNATLTDDQVKIWVGIDITPTFIKDLYHQVINNRQNAITAQDVIDVWKEFQLNP